jgi:hypothetical protein
VSMPHLMPNVSVPVGVSRKTGDDARLIPKDDTEKRFRILTVRVKGPV